MKKSSVLGGLAFAAILGSVFAFPAYAKEKTFPDGIYAGDFALGGLTKEQAEEQFASYVSALEERSITLDVVGNKVETTAKDLGYACANTDALQEAEEYAAGGCLIRQYMERRDLEKALHADLSPHVPNAPLYNRDFSVRPRLCPTHIRANALPARSDLCGRTVFRSAGRAAGCGHYPGKWEV